MADMVLIVIAYITSLQLFCLIISIVEDDRNLENLEAMAITLKLWQCTFVI